jgi:hypothetical protein
VGTIATGIVVVGIVACRGKDSGLKGKAGQDISKVVISVLSGIN